MQPEGGVPVGVPLRPVNAATPGGQNRQKKLLVCAPSNAAVDELVSRLKSGIKTMSGKSRNINVLRLGRSDVINSAVKDVTLDELVRARLEGDGIKDKAKADREKLHGDAARIKEELARLRPQLEEARGLNDQTLHDNLSRQFEELKRQQMHTGKLIDANKDSGNSIAREMEMRRRQIQQEILNSAHVLCATLSGSGHEMFRNLDVEFETVIIDEAAQCVELSALIPLKYGCCKCILVGDPKQLPPTVLSQSAARFGYDQSLFVRMQQNHPKSVHLLDMQYRMHPEISIFPSKEFYERQLLDGPDMLQLRNKPWHSNSLLGPYRFFDVEGVQEKGRKGQSLVNTRELEVAMQLYDSFSRAYQDCDLAGKIGIITPYKAQLFELRRRFKSRYGDGITEMIEFNTTDAFQGRECEVIIFSCVRASPSGGIGFMTDIRRMNVGLTRAKSSLWILGDSRALVQGEFWRKLIENAQERSVYTKGDVLSMLRRPLRAPGDAASMSASAASAGPVDVIMTDAPDASVDEAAGEDGGSKRRELPKEMVGNVGGKTVTGLAGPSSGSNQATPRPVAGISTIHSSTEEGPGTGQKKRSLDGLAAGQPGAKRVRTWNSRSILRLRPLLIRCVQIASDKERSSLMGRFGPKGRNATTQIKDPSAMSVLGLVPPERPPAIVGTSMEAATGTSTGVVDASGGTASASHTQVQNKVSLKSWGSWAVMTETNDGSRRRIILGLKLLVKGPNRVFSYRKGVDESFMGRELCQRLGIALRDCCIISRIMVSW